MNLVSVILPVRNEGDFIERSVGSVLDQTWLANHGPESMEILVVDGRSTDDTREQVERMAAARP
ncbi:MAG TPA: glycosyltransferase, partial [Pseudomonadales bacterium]|nr:glycosyltransferase [Pseudomonadales bacterium]